MCAIKPLLNLGRVLGTCESANLTSLQNCKERCLDSLRARHSFVGLLDDLALLTWCPTAKNVLNSLRRYKDLRKTTSRCNRQMQHAFGKTVLEACANDDSNQLVFSRTPTSHCAMQSSCPALSPFHCLILDILLVERILAGSNWCDSRGMREWGNQCHLYTSIKAHFLNSYKCSKKQVTTSLLVKLMLPTPGMWELSCSWRKSRRQCDPPAS